MIHIQRRVEMFTLMIFGGIRRAKSKVLVKPAKHSKLNQYGNFPKTFANKAFSNEKKYHIGNPPGRTGNQLKGIWEKSKTGMKMVAKLDPTTTYGRKIFPYFMITKRKIPEVVKREFISYLNKKYREHYRPLPKKVK